MQFRGIFNRDRLRVDSMSGVLKICDAIHLEFGMQSKVIYEKYLEIGSQIRTLQLVHGWKHIEMFNIF